VKEHMYYNDLPCWCGRPVTMGGVPSAHYDKELTPEETAFAHVVEARDRLDDHVHDRRGVDHTCWKCKDPTRIDIERNAGN